MIKTQIKTYKEIELMRQSGKILANIISKLVHATSEGGTGKQLDDLANQELKKYHAKAAFLGFQGYPASLCVSINDQIVHGLPTSQQFRRGDIVGLDFGVNYNGMITDAAVTVGIGKISKSAQRLINGTKKALDAALDVVKDGVRVGDISYVIEQTLQKYSLSPIYSLTGHGVGHELHEDPSIPNYGTAGTGTVLRAGMTVAIEPIASLGISDLFLADDNWTYMTRDHSLAAQFEHTVLITEDGCEILTL